ncbi:type II toxin-antitoxin system RnlB family antitoxin [Bacillus safensis]|uniref:type II toxin-antitoxin system RnlB family antitoxin n=1 Tax=Bacillus safensis TaxID=561879 RepID=UPI000A5E74B0|nr:type II toxin-antitoxin system RnlB family antitoxin [Bacillus safensis]
MVGLTVYNKVDKISYCDYYFRKKQDERIVMASDQGKAHNDSIYIPFNGFANNRFLIMQFDGKKFILNSKKIVKDIPDGILKEIYNRYNDNPQWIDQSSLLDVHKEVLRQNFLLIS